MRHPVVSFKMAQTSILTSLRRSIASRSLMTTSSPSTPEQLKPLVQRTKVALSNPFCWQGKEKVKPKGKTSF